ncbi:hypothetical protein A9Q95_16610 [Rhodobacterales bacterium 59_46_T64]|nr:hypothetical protein A9Q95_16610 [Rhodobacterales bacterium 59_46_T64]
MDLRQLRYFLTIVEQGSFSRAAAVLNVAQPALSIHLRKMEDALGTPLLIRRPQGVVPTEAGDLLALRARRILSEMARTEDEIRSLHSDPAGEVRLGFPATVSSILSVPLISAARDRYPRIRINIAEAMSGFVSEWLMDGRIDMAILYNDIGQKGLRSDLLLKEELVMLTPPGDHMPDPVSLADLQRTALILPSSAHGLRRMIDQAARHAGSKLTCEVEIDSFSNIKALVAGAHGCSILPYHAVAAEAKAGLVGIRHFAEPRLWRSAYLVHMTDRPMSRAGEVIADLLRETVATLLADGAWAIDGLIAPDAPDV